MFADGESVSAIEPPADWFHGFWILWTELQNHGQCWYCWSDVSLIHLKRKIFLSRC
jgi:hypothetical protein